MNASSPDHLDSEPQRTPTPWAPHGFEDFELADLSYVVVDELLQDDDYVRLEISGWPTVDERGRLRAPPGLTLRVGLSAEALARRLARLREYSPLRTSQIPEADESPLRERPLRIGDAFGVGIATKDLEAVSARRADERMAANPLGWFGPPIYDVTREARDAAKAAFFSAVGSELDLEKDSELLNPPGEGGG